MAATLRQLLLQRAARLQGRPALTTPDWGTLSWAAWRNRVEGVAFGLLASEPPPASLAPLEPSPWAWALEVAAACAGIQLDPTAPTADKAIFGGALFNAQDGRHAYHEREDALTEATPFGPQLTQGDLMRKLQRWNRKVGWDHATTLSLPMASLGTDAGRAALWNLLYAGGHAVLMEELPPAPKGLSRFFAKTAPPPAWEPSQFEGFWD